MEEHFGEGVDEQSISPKLPSITQFAVTDVIKEKRLSFEEASSCLNTLGKDESGVRYAYLMLTATDRNLTDISSIVNFKHLLFVDLSRNLLDLEAILVLCQIPYLLYLKIDRNMIESAALKPMYYLQVLLLNGNQITETCDINQPMLETLELGDNIIYTSQFDTERLDNLKDLSLHGNHLMDTSGTFPPSLEKLYLNNNKITKVNTNFSILPNLKVLNLRQNNIRKLNGFTEHLVNLTYLNLRSNKINKIRQFRKLICLPKLDTLIILDNPVSGMDKHKDELSAEEDEKEDEKDEEAYGEDGMPPGDATRIPVIVLLPKLTRLNKEMVTFAEREEAEDRKRKIMQEIFEEESSEDETEMPTTTDFTTDYTSDTEKDALIRAGPSRVDYENENETEDEGNFT